MMKVLLSVIELYLVDVVWRRVIDRTKRFEEGGCVGYEKKEGALGRAG